MAVLDITCYDRLASDESGKAISSGMEPSIANLQVAITGSSLASTPLPAGTKFIRVHADVPCRIATSRTAADPVATEASMRMAGGQTEYWGARPGMQIAVKSTT